MDGICRCLPNSRIDTRTCNLHTVLTVRRFLRPERLECSTGPVFSITIPGANPLPPVRKRELMAFKIKDLMVHVPSTGSPVRGRDIAERCTQLTTNVTTIPTTNLFDLAGYSESVSIAVLSTLKEQLKLQLAEVEKLEVVAEQRLLPKTIKEVDMLTQKFTDALGVLKAYRLELARKPKPVTGKYKKGGAGKKQVAG
jgi:hypothetical protein